MLEGALLELTTANHGGSKPCTAATAQPGPPSYSCGGGLLFCTGERLAECFCLGKNCLQSAL